MGIEIHRAALKELQRFPADVLFRAKEAFAFLERGQKLSMPLSRPMPSVWTAAMSCESARGREHIAFSTL